VSATGFTTHRDNLVVDIEEPPLRARIALLRDRDVSDAEIRAAFQVADTAGWQLRTARAQLLEDEDWGTAFQRCLYRAFDVRHIFYHDAMLDRPRRHLMRHMLSENVALLAMRQVVLGAPGYTHFGVSNLIVDNRAFLSNRGRPSVFPLYLYGGPDHAEGALFANQGSQRQPNLSSQFAAEISDSFVLRFIPDGKGDLESTFGPEDIFHYMYGVFHSPTYRERYAELLKIDFPRLPLTSDLGLFRALAEKGEELVALHLMESPTLHQPIAKFPVRGSNEVEKVRYAEPAEGRPGLVYINKTQYFEGVQPEVWEFHIGGYQVLEKWLKDRKGRTLSYDDVSHYGKIVVALKETIRLMGEIDAIIPSWPMA
jgi:predicted helicase